MKKLLTGILLLTLTLFSVQAFAYVKIDYGESKIYTMTDIDFASGLIEDQFSKWRGCTLQNIRYAGDDCNNAKNIEWLNELATSKGEEKNYVQCMECLSDFYVSKDAEKYGFGTGYVYTHSAPEIYQQFLPDELINRKYLKE